MDDAASPPSVFIADPLERAMAHVEAHAFEPLSLASLAGVAGLSPYHFARQFNARFGLAPMAFVRARRLALAARTLSGPNPPALVELAFDTGFESQEGFTRAFRRAFGVSPGRYRRERGAPTSTEIPIMNDVPTPPKLTMEPSPVTKPAFRVAGFGGVFSEGDKSGIPHLWPRLVERLPLAGQSGDDASFGVCWAATAPDGCFHYMASVPITADAPAPGGLQVKDIPAQTYLVFRQQTDGSDLQPQMQAAIAAIWGERVPKSGYKLADGPDLEAYPPGFEPDQPGYVEWWIPVEA